VVPGSQVLPTAFALADELATKAPVTLAAVKYAVLGALDPGIDAGLAYELDLWSRLFGTEGQREGMRAFLEKRPPPPPVSRHGWDKASKGFPWSKDATERSQGKRNKRASPSRV
jgi:hypothetical protein